ncbi:AEC family transporter [Roseibium denhamense]|uniref:AEC family transporter n=1 Tax=Roseibium denhamense TaxID=76305 RepID=A0ABY1PDB8_9HYPH|nr:AEC family transporter [Roseibium denhamense]SMP31147.1 hypothetical protein SAMN06265374_3384 [Roseibium denhamense]
MENNLADLITIAVHTLLPVVLIVLLGFGLARMKAPFDQKIVGSLVSNVGYPALILSHLAKEHILLETFFAILGAAALMIVLFGGLGFAALKIMRVEVKAYLPPMMLSNVGNIGLPVSTLAFGPEGTAVALGFVVIVLTAIFTIGTAIPMGRPDFRALIRQPVLYAVVLAILMMGFGWKLPQPVDQSLSLLAGLAIPLMLLTLGYSLATLKTGDLGQAAVLTAIHIGISTVTALALTTLLSLDQTIEHVVVLLCFMPPSVATYLAVSKYRADEAPGVAGFIFLSTLATLITLPLVLTFWVMG